MSLSNVLNNNINWHETTLPIIGELYARERLSYFNNLIFREHPWLFNGTKEVNGVYLCTRAKRIYK